MLKREKYSEEFLKTLSPGFKGELELLRHEYLTRNAAFIKTLDSLCADDPDISELPQWQSEAAAGKEAMLTGLARCIEDLDELESRVTEGRLARMNDKVFKAVSDAEKQVLSGLTDLQRINSASLQQVFTLGLPAKAKSLKSDKAAALRSAIAALTDDVQFMSNQLQDAAISLKEHNKLITHPLDENHPE